MKAKSDAPFSRADSVVLLNFHDHWKNPLINKYLPGEASEHFEGMLVLRKGRKPLWLSHPFNYAQARKEFSKKGVQVATYSSKKGLAKLLKKSCKRTVGFDASFTSVAALASLKKMLKGRKLVDVSKELGESRELKSGEEAKKISEAVRATRSALAKAKRALKKGMSEKGLADLLAGWLKEEGYGTAFCIVAFGKNTSHIHHSPTAAKRLSKNEPVLIDCGARYQGYVADITETFWFGERKGKSYEEFEKARGTVLEALAMIENNLKPGAAVQVLWRKTKPLGKMPHALGHGIGVEAHDHPGGIGEKTKWKLKEGMVLAIEPALYIDGKFGVRIENDYIITKKGFKRL